MSRKHKLGKLAVVGTALVCAVFVLAVGATSFASPSKTSPKSVTLTKAPAIKMGGTAMWALPAATTPNWIFPFASLAYFSVYNLTTFQYLMYRPLYFFGQITSPDPSFNEQLSLAAAPVYSDGGKTITINLKGWKYSNGQVVDAQSVLFWLNMMKDEGPTEWAGYAPGDWPDNLVSWSAPSLSSLTVTLHMNSTYGGNWLLYNELSQITPMPEAWDITSLTGKPGSGGCGALVYTKAVAAACTKVWTFDTDDNGEYTGKGGHATPHMAADLATYGTNPLWKVVDGPWMLSAFNSSNGEATFVPNPAYSGPQKPYLSKFIEVPFLSDTSEFAALAAGGSSAPQVGYAPLQNVPVNNGPIGSTGANAPQLTSSYNLVPSYGWIINYFPENFNSIGDNGAAGYIFRQLYFRQALQTLVNQPGIIRAVDKGYGVPTYGPVPVYPTNSFASAQETHDLYPYSISAATKLLSTHGWTIHSGGTDTCARPGTGSNECGAGIPKGTPLSFTEPYASGNAAVTEIVNAETSSWSEVGINVVSKAEPFDTVIGSAVPCPSATVKKSSCTWEFANWGGGWLYSPDYLPTGDEIFATGAGSNAGSYNDPTNNHLIQLTNTSSNPIYFTQFENYLQKELPVVWQPTPVYTLQEIAKNLYGVTPINALENVTPEYWHY
ncbi:MAG: ABC transporter substrate-binding protein [Acidimicrobiales bacterium]